MPDMRSEKNPYETITSHILFKAYQLRFEAYPNCTWETIHNFEFVLGSDLGTDTLNVSRYVLDTDTDTSLFLKNICFCSVPNGTSAGSGSKKSRTDVRIHKQSLRS